MRATIASKPTATTLLTASVLASALFALTGMTGDAVAQGAGAGSATPPAAAGSAATPAGSGSAAAPGSTPAPTSAPASTTFDPSAVAPETMPDAVRIRRMEQRVQALKERAWRAKARVGMLRESVLGGGVGSQALIAHANDMGSSFRLVKLVYSLDGTQVFARTDESAESLYKTKKFDIYAGPITPGAHSVSVVAHYRGNGYGVFKYLNKMHFTARGNQTFNASEGRTTKVEGTGYEQGGATAPMEGRAKISFKVTTIAAERPDAAAPAGPTTPAATPTTPAATPGK